VAAKPEEPSADEKLAAEKAARIAVVNQRRTELQALKNGSVTEEGEPTKTETSLREIINVLATEGTTGFIPKLNTRILPEDASLAQRKAEIEAKVNSILDKNLKIVAGLIVHVKEAMKEVNDIAGAIAELVANGRPEAPAEDQQTKAAERRQARALANLEDEQKQARKAVMGLVTDLKGVLNKSLLSRVGLTGSFTWSTRRAILKELKNIPGVYVKKGWFGALAKGDPNVKAALDSLEKVETLIMGAGTQALATTFLKAGVQGVAEIESFREMHLQAKLASQAARVAAEQVVKGYDAKYRSVIGVPAAKVV
jgi:nitrogen regulatory protein PII-like uncharacterized protein